MPQVNTIGDMRKFVEGVRFTKGHYVIGPEYFGCSGTGMRPCILRQPYKNLPIDDFFFVGPELVVDQLKRKIAMDRLSGRNRFTYYENDAKPDKRRAVHVFKTRRNAIEKFLDLCEEIMKWNREQAEEARKAVERLKQNPMDTEAALALGDLGVL